MSKYKWLQMMVVALALVFAIYMFVNFITTGETKTHWQPEILVAERISNSGVLHAKITTTNNTGSYHFFVASVKGGVVNQKYLYAPVGYHPHLITLVWDPISSEVTATIDHDFGEGNVVSRIRISSEQ